jgi:hypothetical protein
MMFPVVCQKSAELKHQRFRNTRGWHDRRSRPCVQRPDCRTFARMTALQLQFLMMFFAGWVNRSQQGVIEYLQAENRVLREQLGDGRLLLTDG